jgi:Fur family peroxide stress response transcriptional regulator
LENVERLEMLDTEYATGLIRAHNMRVTPQRRAVIDFLIDNTSHPVVEDVAEYVQGKMPNVALSTIYNTLHELTNLGLIRQVDVGGVMHFDPQNTSHAHLICCSCGTLVDIPLEADIEKELRSAVERCGAHFSTSQIDVVGLCPACKQ